MNKTEVAKLLTMASAIDNRTVGTETVEAWFMVVGDVDFEDATSVMFQHFRTSTDYLTPRQIIMGVEALDRKRRAEARQLEVDRFIAMRDHILEIETERVSSGEEKDPSKLTALSRGEWKEEWRIDSFPEAIASENGDPQVRIET
jgi:hypothetical protein